MEHWEYRIMVHRTFDGVWFAVHLVKFDNNKPVEVDSNIQAPEGNSIDDVQYAINRFKECLNEPIYWYGERFPEKFDYDKEMMK